MILSGLLGQGLNTAIESIEKKFLPWLNISKNSI